MDNLGPNIRYTSMRAYLVSMIDLGPVLHRVGLLYELLGHIGEVEVFDS